MYAVSGGAESEGVDCPEDDGWFQGCFVLLSHNCCWPDACVCVLDQAPARTRNRVVILAPAVVLRNWQVTKPVIG